MDEIKLSNDVFDQIKYFDCWSLTEEQELLIDKLILSEELKDRYKYHGLCKKCKQPNTYFNWCQPCIFKYFQRNFQIWTSGNHDVDEIIQKAQLKAKNAYQVLEWIEYDRFENVEYLAKGGFGTTYKAIWKEEYLSYNYDEEQFTRKKDRKKDDEKGHPVALKCLHNTRYCS